MITVNHYLALSAVLFSIGVVGVLTRRNIIVIMMSIELMLNAGNLLFVTFARHMGDMGGHVFVFMVMAVAAAEAAVGLAIALALFKNRATVDIDEMNILKG
ncbi:MAG: NADH-quinone oxidoreductase subunit NuoK [Nitrospinae bacterium]|nr:NADH-quinone oxidoreductase subunit NuoK [Nitrospinota bacterium]